MSRTAMIGIWITMSVVMGIGLHYYIWRRLIRQTALPRLWARATLGMLIFFGLCVPVVLASRFFGSDLPVVLRWLASGWLAFGFFVLVVLLIIDGVRATRRLIARVTKTLAAPVDPGRRLALSRMVAGTTVVTSGGLGGFALHTALTPPRLRRVRVPLGRLPAAASGTRIVQLTDLHVGQSIGDDFVADLVVRTNALAPDIIVITGDLVDGPPRRLAAAVEPLADLRARHGVYFITGNHEYYAGVEPWLAYLPSLGLRVMRNERVAIGAGAAAFDLAGLDDRSAGRFFPGRGPDIAKALRGRDPTRELVLLAHQPQMIWEAMAHGVGLQISGHTHGGQVWPITWIAHLVFPLVHGLGRFGDTMMYVSRGIGFVGPPVRLGAPAELTEIELIRDDGTAAADIHREA